MNADLIAAYPQLSQVLALSSINRGDCNLVPSGPAVGFTEIYDAVKNTLPMEVVASIKRLCLELIQSNDVLALAFPPDLRKKWNSIKINSIDN